MKNYYFLAALKSKNRFLKISYDRGLAESDAIANKSINNFMKDGQRRNQEFQLLVMFKLIIDILNELVML